MKKRIISLIMLILVLVPYHCYAGVYPEYIGANKVESAATERINIIFDNSGHDDVKEMFLRVLTMAAICENSDVWVYPIAGSVAPILVEPEKDFVDAHFVEYSKSSNEFKAENVLELALWELQNDPVANKKLILFANYSTSQIREEYALYQFGDIAEANPGITFSSFYSHGTSYDGIDLAPDNMEHMYGKSIVDLALIKNGYSACEFTYDKANGVVAIEKGKADKNIFIKAESSVSKSFTSDSDASETSLYISGCMIGGLQYEECKDKDKIKGVSLSYNHLNTEGVKSNESFACALFTADGTTINPAEESLFIPVINASEIEVYYRSTPGAGVCSAETEYNREQDDKIININAPEPTEEPTKKENLLGNIEREPSRSTTTSAKNTTNPLSIVTRLLGIIFSVLFTVLRLAILAFIILLIVHKKFRSYVHIKILQSKIGPNFEKATMKIKKLIKDIAGTAVKVKGTADFKEKYIFISHASADMLLPNNRIELVIKELEKRGVKCWLAENSIQPGQNYNAVLPEAIKHCCMFIVFISPTSAGSIEVTSEVSTAKEYKKMIVPVQIEPFDLFKKFPDWGYMLKQSQKTDLFNSKQEVITPFIDYIEKSYNEL